MTYQDIRYKWWRFKCKLYDRFGVANKTVFRWHDRGFAPIDSFVYFEPYSPLDFFAFPYRVVGLRSWFDYLLITTDRAEYLLVAPTEDPVSWYLLYLKETEKA